MDAWTGAAGWIVAAVLGAFWAVDHYTQTRILEQYKISREYWLKKWQEYTGEHRGRGAERLAAAGDDDPAQGRR